MSGKPVQRDGANSDPWADWYDTYRRQRDERDAADTALRVGLKRQIGWISWFIAVWTAVVCGASGFVIWLLFW